MLRPKIITSGISFIVFSFLISQLITQPGCANIIPPQGGPRDSLPPVVISVDPRDSSTNFNKRTIVFTFDEYVSVDNITQNMLVSPTPDLLPKVDPKLKTITVRLKDTLEPNTTYRIDFGNAIRDVNENNILKGYSYIFTTGDQLDSLTLEGNVILAETGKIDTTLIVMLHRSGEDSAVIKQKPRYVVRLDNKGQFQFRFLPPGTYYLYALKDENNTRRYFPPLQLFAFADQPVVIGDSTKPITLYAFADKKETPATTILTQPRPGANRTDDRRLRFTTNLNNYTQDLLGKLVISVDQPLRNFDSSKLVLSTDSAYNSITNYSWELDSTRKKITLTHAWKENTLYNLIMDKDFAEDTSGKKLLKTDTIHFTTKKQGEYGTLKIRFRNVEMGRNPVLQFIQNNIVVKAFPLTSENFQQPLFLPGEYELRILYDENRNGVWDPGDFFKGRRQPEIVKPIERKILLRPSFDNDFEVSL